MSLTRNFLAPQASFIESDLQWGLKVDIQKQIMRLTTTSLYKGGSISVNAGDNTTWDHTAFECIFVDNTTDPANPQWKFLRVPAATGIAVPDIGTQPVSFVSVDVDGNFIFETALPPTSTIRSQVLLGVLIHLDLATLSAVEDSTQQQGYDVAGGLYDLARSIVFINQPPTDGSAPIGNLYSEAGTNLTIQKTAGRLFFLGGRGKSDTGNPTDPNFIPQVAQDPITIVAHTYSDGAGGFTLGAATTILDVGFYDDKSGTLAVVNNMQWTVMRVYMSNGNLTFIHYGTTVFNSLQGALNDLGQELNFVLNPLLATAMFRAWFIVRGGAVNLSLASDRIFKPAGKYGDLEFQ